jgi:autotransporter-associated beta strand protein
VSGADGTTGIFAGSPAFTATDKNLSLYGASGTGTKEVSGAINLGAGSLAKEASGTWILSAGNSYSGGTTISAGGLNAQAAGSLGSGSVTVSSTAAPALRLGNAAAMNSGNMFAKWERKRMGPSPMMFKERSERSWRKVRRKERNDKRSLT